MTSVSQSGGLLASLLPANLAQAKPQDIINNATKNGGSSLSGLSQFNGLKDILSLSPLAKQILENPTQALNQLPTFPAQDGFGYSSSFKFKFELSAKSISTSSISDGGNTQSSASINKIKLSISASSEIVVEDGKFYSISKVSVSFKGLSINASSSTTDEGSSSSASIQKSRFNFSAVIKQEINLADLASFGEQPVLIDAADLTPPTNDDTGNLETLPPEPVLLEASDAPALPAVAAGEVVEAIAEEDAPAEQAAKPVSAPSFGSITDAFAAFFSARTPIDFSNIISNAGQLFSPRGETPFTDANNTRIQLLETNFRAKVKVTNVSSGGGQNHIEQLKLRLASSQYFAQTTQANTTAKALAEEVIA